MTVNEIAFLKSLLQPDNVMLEWGCGGSTLEYSKYVKEYYSIEHSKIWADKISQQATANTHIFHIEPEFAHSGFDPAKRGQFTSYVNFPLTLNKDFDIIIIDGRDRLNCSKVAKQLLKSDGLLLLHDFFPSRMPRYGKIVKDYEPIVQVGSLAVFVHRIPRKHNDIYIPTVKLSKKI
ncbi:hypothetical protein BH09PAT1_BH09PAT1_2790 [soil metagenome]